MKKIILCLLLLWTSLSPIKANELAIKGESAYLIEYESGKVLYAKNETKRLYPASMTKMMGLIIIFEELNAKRLNWDDLVIASSEACSMGGTQIYLKEKEQMKVRDLVSSIIIASANDAMVAMGEHIAGSHQGFVEMMNQKAKQLKLVQTHFKNATGLHDDDHYSCAKDMAIIGKKLIEVGKGELLKITSTYDGYIRSDSEPFWLVNTNKLLKSYPGVDGLKTGFTSQALSCITVSAKRSDIRLIAVVMKASDSKTRNKDIATLLDYGFASCKKAILYDKGKYQLKMRVNHGDKDMIKVGNKEVIDSLSFLKQKQALKKLEAKYFKQDAPIKKNEVVGKLVAHYDGYVKSYQLIAMEAVKEQSFMEKTWIHLKQLLF